MLGEKLDILATQTRDTGDYLCFRLQITGGLEFQEKIGYSKIFPSFYGFFSK